jgi:hypothetical protein
LKRNEEIYKARNQEILLEQVERQQLVISSLKQEMLFLKAIIPDDAIVVSCISVSRLSLSASVGLFFAVGLHANVCSCHIVGVKSDCP